jgi:hypothetical protein
MEVWLIEVPIVAWGGLVTPIVPVAVTCALAWISAGFIKHDEEGSSSEGGVKAGQRQRTEPAMSAAERKTFSIVVMCVIVGKVLDGKEWRVSSVMGR